MSASRRDQWVAVDEEVRTPDGGGGATVTWREVKQTWAQVVPVGAREQLTAQQQIGTAIYRVRLARGDFVEAGIKAPSHRLRWLSNGGMVMNIRAVPDDGPRADEVTLLVETGVAV
jgi:head-tail adaptor